MSVHRVETGSSADRRNSPQDIRSQDLGAHRAREIRGTCHPLDTDEVQRLVLRAAREGTPVYSLSTGRNWGMGSRHPVFDGCTILDLSRMTTIRTADLDRGYAVVEPGVTQRQLVELLDGTPWMLNVTSGCADASLVGNTIERGDGTIRARVEDLLGLEVVLGTGEIMTTGGLDRHGGWSGTVAGPDLTRAFLQSNLGVVTAMAIGFVPRPEAVTLVNATYAKTALAEVVDTVVRVGRTRVATHGMLRLKELFVVPAAGRAAIADTADPDLFTVQVPLLGSREAVWIAENDMRDTLGRVDGLVSYRSLDTATTPITDPLYPRTLFARGIASCLHLRQSLGIDECARADEARIGWLTFLPVVPLQQHALCKAVELFGLEAERHGVAGMLEFNVISPHTTNMVAQIPFVREPEAMERAHALRHAVRRVFLEAGFPPYRSNIDQMPWELVDRSGTYRDVPLEGLKRLFDPADIISPGRYLVVNR
ncbi:FAD-binding oxidoreductase [Nocardia sputorum]|uniref:FAD-binding oxidoreductase n=1 Tax=Nocardia sputorum TaxID=2984338 RepID=UPI002492D786|nr:FAD-binding oxidoreductase [Nocardia sputorum]